MKIRCFLILFLVIIISSIHFAQTLSPGDGIRIIFYNITDPISGDYFV